MKDENKPAASGNQAQSAPPISVLARRPTDFNLAADERDGFPNQRWAIRKREMRVCREEAQKSQEKLSSMTATLFSLLGAFAPLREIFFSYRVVMRLFCG
jgi:hypothetical protein